MDIKLAATFLKVAEIGNITKAAEQLGYSQASVTSHIQQLEQHLGVQLFDRIGRGIQLTDAGSNFRPYAAELIKASENADAFAANWDDPRGTLTIEASSGVSIGILSRLLGKFHEQYPKVQIIIWPNDDTDPTIERLRQNRSDFAMFTDRLQRFEGCTTFFSQYVPFIFVAPPDDPVTHKKNVPLEEILDDTFIDCPTAYEQNHIPRSALSPVFERLGKKPALEIASAPTALSILRQGRGRAFLPVFMARPALQSGPILRVDAKEPDSGIYMQMLYNENRWLNPQMQAFHDFILRHIQGMI